MITQHTTQESAAKEWNKPGRRAGLARVVNGIMYIFDRPSDAIGHPTTQVQHG